MVELKNKNLPDEPCGASWHTGGKKKPCQNAAVKPHECPFASEINDDDTKCRCCSECQSNCAEEAMTEMTQSNKKKTTTFKRLKPVTRAKPVTFEGPEYDVKYDLRYLNENLGTSFEIDPEPTPIRQDDEGYWGVDES